MNQLFPFRFERMKSGKVIASNDLGYFHFFPSVSELSDFIGGARASDNLDLKRKYFCTDEEDQYDIGIKLFAGALYNRYESSLCRPSLFMIVPTLRCDHDCTYCQVSRESVTSSGYDLDESLIAPIIKKIKDYGVSPYKIEFQGGEPLLRFDLIQKIYEEAEEVLGNGEVSYVIATSLSLLNQEMLGWCLDKNISFSVSLDGTEVIHNSKRKNILGSSHQMMKKSMDMLLNSSLGDRVGVVTTITNSSISFPDDIIEAHLELGLKDMFVRPISPFGFSSSKYDSHYSVNSYLEYYGGLLRSLVDNYSMWGIREYNAILHIRKIFNISDGSYVDLKSPSGHLLGALVFDYSGRVFGSDEARMLYKSYGLEDLSLGFVNEMSDLSEDQNSLGILSSTFITEHPGCDECAYQAYCGVDAMHHISTQGDVVGDKSLSRFCELQKGLFEIIFELLSEDESRNVLEGWVYG